MEGSMLVMVGSMVDSLGLRLVVLRVVTGKVETVAVNVDGMGMDMMYV